MAEVKPFSALRYDIGRAGPLEDLVAPPYDVIGPAEREQFLARSRWSRGDCQCSDIGGQDFQFDESQVASCIGADDTAIDSAS